MSVNKIYKKSASSNTRQDGVPGSMRQCEFCGGEADFFGHFEQHLSPPRKVDVCKACHMRVHAGLFRKRYFLHQGVVVPVEERGEFVQFGVSLPVAVVDGFQEWCYRNGWSMGLAVSAFMEHLLKLDKVLPFEVAVKVAAVATFEFLKAARLAYVRACPDDVVYYAIRVEAC